MKTFTSLPIWAALAGAALAAAQELVERKVLAMGTVLELSVWAETRAQALEASELALREVERVETCLSTWKPESELSRLNRTPVGEPFELSSDLERHLGRARHLWEWTEGAFDPGLGLLVQAWGLREGGRQPSQSELEQALAAGSMASLEVGGGRATRRSEMQLEEGAFGKGIGLDEACAVLERAGIRKAVLNLGGQVRFVGQADGWPYGVAHPLERGEIVLEVVSRGGSLATSGNSERGLVVGGERRSHILDPRKGTPAPDVGSMTVWARDATTADALSTALFVLGPERGLAWAARQDGLEALHLISSPQGLQATATPGLRGRIRGLVAELELTFLATPALATRE